MSKTMKKVSALLLALLMIFSFMPMTQETAFAAAKKPGKVKSLKIKVSGKKMTISWKKAKNAKKYKVSIKDNSTKLTATKTTKKKKLTVTGQYNTKYTITVQGVNKNGKAGKKVKKSAKTEVDPAYTKAEADKAAAEQKAADAEQKAADAEQKAADAEKKVVEAEAAKAKAEEEKAAADKAAAEAKAAAEEAEKKAEEAKGDAELYEKLAEKALEAAEEAKKAELEAQIKAAALGVTEEDLQKAQEEYKALDEIERLALADSKELTLDTWNPEVKDAINSMIKSRALGYEPHSDYVVFDFDNTCSIFDVEEQLAVYQLQKMAFAETMTVGKLREVLLTGLTIDPDEVLTKGDFAGWTYNDWVEDIVYAYGKLLEEYGEYDKDEDEYYFTPYGLDDEKAEEIQDDKYWKQFATKMRAMYDLVYDNESASVAYPWVLYWFTGMSRDQVYNLAYESHDAYRAVATTEVTWTSPEAGRRRDREIRPEHNKVGSISVTWTSGTTVSQNIVELMAALDNAGIDVWVCSASAVDPIRAAVDIWGLHDYVTGVMAMTNKYDAENDAYINAYDYASGYAWLPLEDGSWEEADGLHATEAQTQGKGKVVAVQNVCGLSYGKGPIAGFMDSTGDFNFCSEFKDLEVVTCFNRANRKVTDGGGLVAEVACYEADALGYDYAKAKEAGDVLYVLQGREENGLRGLLNLTEEDIAKIYDVEVSELTPYDKQMVGRGTLRLGKTYPLLFRNDDNYDELEYFTNKKLAVKDIMNTYAISTEADDPKNKLGFKYGFLAEYDGYKSQTGDIMDNLDKKLTLDSWNPEVKEAINRMILANRTNKETGHKYVVFDFDNTCSIFDVEEQLAVYQLQRMAFASDMTPEKLAEVLATGLNEEYFTKPAPASKGYCANANATYQDWIDDIVAAYKKLLASDFAKYDTVGGKRVNEHFTPEGLSDADSAAIQENADWQEFATKMRAMYDCVFDSESADVAYPWVLYWFTGMTEKEVYTLAKASHTAYKDVDTSTVTWNTPADYGKTNIGAVEYSWTSGTAVSDNIRELMGALDANGIDVWVCSASATDPIRAAIDVWGLHPYVTGMMAMTNTLEDGKYINEYDYKTGVACIPKAVAEGKEPTEADWTKGEVATQAQTQGAGKSKAINNVLVPEYGMGPIAGFMDSTGDFNFCTEYDDLEVVCCFNRASRKVTDGGGLVAEVAVYEADTLGYNYAKAKAAGDTLYVLQGREENGKRGLLPQRETMRLGATEPKLFANADNQTELDYFIAKGMSVENIMNTFAIKTAADDKDNPFSFKYGFLEDYAGYHAYPPFPLYEG